MLHYRVPVNILNNIVASGSTSQVQEPQSNLTTEFSIETQHRDIHMSSPGNISIQVKEYMLIYYRAYKSTTSALCFFGRTIAI